MKSNILLMLSLCFLFTACGAQNHDSTKVSAPNDEMTGKPAQAPHEPPQDGRSPKDPSQGKIAQAIGFYSHGSQINADRLEDEGYGFVKILRPRERRYSSFDMNYILRKIAEQMADQFPQGERMQIADIAEEHGGLAVGHASHQNGLDADIAYFRLNHTEQDPNISSGFEEFFVNKGKLTKNFDMPRNWAAIKAAVDTKRVNRIFVNQVIKDAFCAYAKKVGEYTLDSEYLRRLRPYEGHMDHFHLRITCPNKSKQCVSQEEVPPGSGC